jgi:hypothetical protein
MFTLILVAFVSKHFKLYNKNFFPVIKTLRIKLIVCKIINLKLYFVNTVIPIATKILFECYNNKTN